MNLKAFLTDFHHLRWVLREYERVRNRDLILFPYHLLRWLVAYIITALIGIYHAIAFKIIPDHRLFWSRTTATNPVMCRYCLWGGMIRECYHGYDSDGDGDVEAEDCCPRCDGEIF